MKVILQCRLFLKFSLLQQHNSAFVDEKTKKSFSSTIFLLLLPSNRFEMNRFCLMLAFLVAFPILGNAQRKRDYLTFDSLALYHFDMGNDSLAKLYCQQSLKLKEMRLGKESPSYATSLSLLSEIELDLNNETDALFYAKESQRIRKAVLGERCVDYVNSLNVIAEIYFSMANYNDASEFALNAYRLCLESVPKASPEYSRSLNSLALSKHAQGYYDDAVAICLEALNLRSEVQGKESLDYLISLGNLAVFYSDAGNYMEALRIGTEAANILKKKYGESHWNYLQSLDDLGYINTELGNYSEALRLFSETLSIRKKKYDSKSPSYVRTLNNIAFCHSELGHKQQAVETGELVVKLCQAIYGSSHSDCGAALGNLAMYYCDIGDYKKALTLSNEAVEIYKNVYGEKHPDYALVLVDVAQIRFHLGEITEACRLLEKALQIREETLGSEHPDVALSLNILSLYAYHLNNFSKAYDLEKRSIDILLQHIKRNFPQMSSFRRKSYWSTYQKEFCNFYPSLVYKHQNPKSISDLYDKTALFAKSILLNTDIEMRELIYNSADSLLLDDYLQMVSNKEQFNKLVEQQDYNESALDSFKLIIQEQEDDISTKSLVYGNYIHNLNISWIDVQKNLRENEIAIEFLDFSTGKDSTMYVALTLKRNYESPHMVTLFEKKQLMAIPERDYYTQTSTYDLIWKPLEQELGNVHNIYFSPSGELHRIGIEYLPVSRTENINDKYLLHRLSSTKQLALIQDGIKGKQNILYGGINYDESTNATSDVSTSPAGAVRGIDAIFRSNVDSLLLRSSYEYLEGTKKEVDQIVDQMKQHQLHYQYYSGPDGSEESFKKLDGTKPRVMHIATHGFYLTEEEAQQSNFARPHMELMMGDYQRAGHPIEDKPMTRSGLLFSGCNHAIHHEQIPDGVEDGILTAQEISTLDLRGLELVVLSACQTALGDIASGEGVFGLQRGFKKAGAKTILMSIDKVDDEATRILMVEFYSNLMSGKSKYQSLKDAQKYLREYDNRKYDNPRYWASFILLDGLD